MRILTIGAGAIGAFIGGSLLDAGHEVMFLELPQVAGKILNRGIRVEGLGRKIHIENPMIISELKGYPHFDLAIVAVKSYSTRAAIGNIPGYATQKVLTFQNGIGNEEILSEKFGNYRVIAGTITYPVSIMDMGHIKIANTNGGLGISAMDPSVDLTPYLNMFKSAGLDCNIYYDYRSLKWSKLILNLVCNATCAILGMTPGEIFSDRRLVCLEREQILEALNVMKQMKIQTVDLPGYQVDLMKTAFSFLPPSFLKLALRKKIHESRGAKKPSLLIEMEKGSSKTEIDFYNGAVYREATKLGIKAPVNKILTDTINGITSGELNWNEFRGEPGKLYTLCKECIL